MSKYFHRGDMVFSLLLSFFLCWGRALQMVPVSVLNVLRLLSLVLVVAVLLEIVLALVAYLRGGKGLFGRRASVFFFWRRSAMVSVSVSAFFTLFYAIFPPSGVVETPWLRLAVLFVLGVVAGMLYLRSLVKRN